MIPLFKSTYSRKSILTLEKPDTQNDGPDSIFSIAKDHGLQQIVLVEDEFTGFKTALDRSKELGINLIFGIRFNVCNERISEDQKSSAHKLIVFAKNDDGARELMKLYSLAFTESGGFLDCATLKEKWSPNLSLAIPFYDSFIHRNAFYFQTCVPDLQFATPTVFLENNGLPYNETLRTKAIKLALENNWPTVDTKTIYYRNNHDYDAYVTYRIVTGRIGGKNQTLDKPELEDMSSDEFSFESYLENTNLLPSAL
jgi:DNA polymerase III alpha subunit